MLGVAKWKGERLEQLLDRQGKNPAWLGKQIGKPKQSVYQWIEGSEPRDDRVWDDIAKTLRVDPELFRDPHKALQKSAAPDRVERVSLTKQPPAVQSFMRGDMAVLPVWRGIVAGLTDECYFQEPDTAEYDEVPAFLIEGRNVDRFIVCIPAGSSLSPRIKQGWRVIAKLDSTPPINTLVVAETPDRKRFIKALREKGGKLELHSTDSNRYPPIKDLAGWVLLASVRAIWGDYESGAPNIEWDNGRPLKA